MKQIEKAINAMAIDWSHAATGNRVKWAFTSDTSRDDIEMVIAIYRKNARRPYMVIFPIYNTMRGTLNTCNAPVIEGEAAESIKGDYMKGIENVNAFKVTGSPYDNDGCSMYAPVIDPAQQPAAAPQTAENDQTTDNTAPAENAAQDATQAATAATENNTAPAQGTQEKRRQSRMERLEKLRRPYYTRLYPLWHKLMRPRLMPMQGPNTISWDWNHRME